MTPSNLILHCFHRRVGWVIRTFQIHGAKNCDDLFFGTKTGFGLLKRVTSPAFEEFFVFIEKNHPTRFSKKTLHKISIQKPQRFWMDVFFFQIPHQTSSTDKKLQGTWIWSPTVVGRVGFGSLLRPLTGDPPMDGLVVGVGWVSRRMPKILPVGSPPDKKSGWVFA